MSETAWHPADDTISMFGLGTILVRNRWRIARWMLAGVALAAYMVASKPPRYVASASFVNQGSDPGRSGLASLAGQFGVSIPTGNLSLSPDFYAKLIESRELLLPIARDTFVVQELQGRRIPFFQLFEIAGPNTLVKEERAVGLLKGMVEARVVKTTGVVEVSVASERRSVSLAIVAAVVEGVSEYNQRRRQSQASDERRFVEGRLEEAGMNLREAESRLERFMRANRDFGSSPELFLERERIQRSVALRQQLFTMLMQSYEEARIREVRDTPVITMFESPAAPSQPEPRGRIKSLILGMMFGGFIGAILALISGLVARHRNEGRAEASEFVSALGEVRREIVAPFRWLRRGRA